MKLLDKTHNQNLLLELDRNKIFKISYVLIDVKFHF